jgi:putative transcriptional regulator
MVNYHPADELLTAYTAGSLQLSHALCISTHIEHCKQCQANMQRLNALGGNLLEQLEPEVACTDLKDNVMAMLDDLPAQAPAKPASEDINSNIPRPLRQFIPASYDELPWKRVSPSIQTATLCTDENGAEVSLLKIKPGGEVGHHSHMGDEITVILEGSFSDEEGIYRQGDFMMHGSDHKHKPIATKDAECICLIVQDAPIQFTGFFSRLLNPFLRKGYQPA